MLELLLMTLLLRKVGWICGMVFCCGCVVVELCVGDVGMALGR